MKKIAYIALAGGILLALLSLLADVIGLGKGGIQAAQLLGLQIGILFVLAGWGSLLVVKDGYRMPVWRQIYTFGERILDLPVTVWFLVSFLGVYFLFFVSPVFLNAKLQMAYVNRYLPHTGLIGADIRVFVEYIEQWLRSGQSPYKSGYIAYPPFSFFLFSPLVLVGYPANFRLITMMTLASYLLVAFIVPRLLLAGKSTLLLLLVFVSGLFSYGFQFELERGQSNLIAFAFCIFGIYIFHFHRRFRLFAYLLFSLSVQLKLYPAIFILLFVDDWQAWMKNIKRFLGLALFNVLLLFVMGIAAFEDFVKALLFQQFNLSQWNGNHSIRAFAVNFTSHGFGLFSPEVVAFLGQYTRVIEVTLMGIVVGCIVFLIFKAYRRKERGLNPYLLLACTIGALVIPSVSNDYKLSLLPASVAILFSGFSISGKPWKKLSVILLILLFSSAFWSALYPFKVKPEFLSSTFPLLLIMLVLETVLYFVVGNANREIIPA
ncbi:MAG: hypothetical protein Fur0043_01840 [Anaerolineales bacterium]